MKKLLLGALVALLPLTGFAATILGIQAGTGTWKHDPSGVVSTSADGAGVTADLKNDLNLAEKSEGYTYFSIEHPVPLIPNFKFVNTNLTTSGTGAVNFTFDNVTYSSAVNTKLDLSHTDYILYYEVLDNVVSLDVGLNAKNIEGQIAIGSTAPTNFSGTIPMLYAAVEVMLPAGFALAAEISTISSGNDAITDTTAKVTYTTDFNLGIEAGVRTLSIDVDVDTVKANIEFSGIFAGVYFKF
jgi:outer membrane protein